ncbi:hypothetical protein MBLNU459_g3905t1 [Dothideomycetes sp. NU459]
MALGAGATFPFPFPLPCNPWSSPSPCDPWCLSYEDAEQIGNDFATLISAYNATFANLVLASDYTDQSDSVNTLIDSGTDAPIPLGNLTFASKAAFLAGQGSQPNVPFKILNRWHTCDTVIIRWVAEPGPQQVQGFDAIIVEPSTDGFQRFQIKTVYGEFNSGAWLADLGRPECNVTAA